MNNLSVIELCEHLKQCISKKLYCLVDIFLELTSLAKEDKAVRGNISHEAKDTENRKEMRYGPKLPTIHEDKIETSSCVANALENVVQKSDAKDNARKKKGLSEKNVENDMNVGSKDEKNTNAPSYQRKFFKSRAKKQNENEKSSTITKQEMRNEREKMLLENQQKRKREQEEKKQKHKEEKCVKEQERKGVIIGKENGRSTVRGKVCISSI